MPINQTIKGDLIKLALDGQFNVIAHGCNCFCTMGKGIAKQIKQEFPMAYLADQDTKKRDIQKLGTYSYSYERDVQVINAYTQYDYRATQNGDDIRRADYGAIKAVFETINDNLRHGSSVIGIPLIGAGLAGGDWNIISEIINDATPDIDITLVEYEP